jgi:glycerophosphoryl diester phosphodiesterase
MLFLSHRGYWREPDEKNTEAAFSRSFALGFGTETDVRDLDGQLVIAHDPPRAGAWPLARFLELYARHGRDLPLALNIKSDGIEALLAEQLERHGLAAPFVFDMSVPDTLRYLRRGLRFFTRQSEHEPSPALYPAAAGIWVDGFAGDWVTAPDIAHHLDAGKAVCLVSPELHGRDPLPLWQKLGRWLRDGALPAGASATALMLCTDQPERAREIVQAAIAGQGGA